ncbi:non-SMC element 2, MMS21 [Arthrobotrys megalospora]
MPPRRPQDAPRRVKRAPLPDHESCVLPIHDSKSGELRALHAKYPPQNLHRWIKDATESLRDSSSKFAENRREKVFEQEKERDEEKEQQIAELGVRVEKNIRGLVDMDEQLKMMKSVLQSISEAEKNRGNADGVQPVEEFLKRMKRENRAYRRRDLKDRYGNSAEYIELRSLVHGLAKPTAPQPQKKDWFKTPMFVCDGEAQISDEEAVSESEGEDGPSRDRDIEMVDRDDESDDGIQEVAVTRNLKCPLTMQLFKDPVKAACGHSFEKEALLEMLKEYKKQKKATICPTTGCGKEIHQKDLKPDALTKRLAEAKSKESELKAQRAVVAGARDDDPEDEDDAPSHSKKRRLKSKSVPVKEEEIPYGSDRSDDRNPGEEEERVADSHDEGEENGEEEKVAVDSNDESEEEDEKDEEMEDEE